MTNEIMSVELEVRSSLLSHNDTAVVNLLNNHDREDDEPNGSVGEHNDRAPKACKETAVVRLFKFYKKHWKKVIMIGICIVVVGILSVIVYAVLKSINQDNGNTSNNITSHANASGRTSPNEQETCIFHTPEDFLEKHRKDPLEDKCNKSSKYVRDFQDFCNKNGTSKQQCRRCGAKGIYLPDFCFCDQLGHCDDPLYDRKGTIECKKCSEMFNNSPYKDRGKCSCSSNKVMIQCSCHEGFANDMCSSIEKRLCSRKKTNETLENCNESNNDTCVFIPTNGTEFICNIFSDENRELRENTVNLNNCSLNQYIV